MGGHALICEVCEQQPALGVASLPFAPYSAAFCRECISKRAYPLWTLDYLLNDVGNGDDANLVDDVKDFHSFHKGRYVGWDEVKQLVRKETE